MTAPLPRFIPLAAAFITIVAVLAGVFEVDRLEQERLAQQSRSRTLDQLSIIRGNIESALNARVFLGRGLVAYTSTHPGITVPEFRLFAAALVRQQSGIRSIQLAKGSIVSHIYPLKGNEAALGLKLLEIPAQRDAVQRAIQSRKTVVAGPVDLVQGGKAFVSRTPVFLPSARGKPDSGTYWGLATIVIDMAPLFEEAGLSQDLFTLRYALRGRDGTGANGGTFWGDPELFEMGSVRLDITLPNGSWQIAAMPGKKWAKQGSSWLRQGGILLALVAGILVWFLTRNPDKLRQMVQQTTSALRESEKKYRYLVQDANSIILQVDKHGKIIFINEYAQHFFGWNESEILGLNLLNTIAPKNENPGRNLATMIEDASQNQHSEQGSRSEYETTRKNGERVWVSWSNRIIHDDQGRFTGFLCVGTDISERKRAETSLKEAHASLETKVAERTAELRLSNDNLKSEIAERRHTEDRLHNQLLLTQALFEAIPSPVFYKNRKGEYLGCNQAFEKAFGLSRQRIMGATVYDLMPKDLADIYYAQDEALFREPGLQIYESQVGLADGARRNVIFYKATFTDASGELSGLVGVVLDITERKQMEEALRRAHDELEERVRERTAELARTNDELTAEITERKRLEQQIVEVSEEGQKRIGQELHDGLGQHLTGVAFLGKALEQKLAARSLPEVADAAEIVNFLNQAITQTRVLARGLFPVELENNGLMSALEQLASSIHKLFGIACIFRCTNPILVHDRLTAINLYRIAQEAVTNAAKHSKASHILIELAAEGDKTHLTISDNGTGLNIQREHQGMGLHIMRYRANMLGASIRIQGSAGGGTEVRVSLDQ